MKTELEIKDGITRIKIIPETSLEHDITNNIKSNHIEVSLRSIGYCQGYAIELTDKVAYSD